MSKRPRDDEEGVPPPPPPPKPALLDARNISPLELFDNSDRVTGHVIDVVWDRSKFRFVRHHDGSAFDIEDAMTLSDPFNLMPTLSVLLNLEMLIHVPSMSVVQVLNVRKGTTVLSCSKPSKMAKVKTMEERVGRHLGSNITLVHPHETHTKNFKPSAQVHRLLDNFFTLSPPDGDKVVKACKFYPLATALRTPARFLGPMLDEPTWNLACRSLVEGPGPVDPVRIAGYMKSARFAAPHVEEVVQSAMVYHQFARDRSKLWVAESEVPAFAKTNKLLLPDQENPSRYSPWCTLPLIAQFRNWVRGDVVTKPINPHRTTYVQYDANVCGEDGLQHHLMMLGLPVVTLYPHDSVRGAFEGFAGFPVTPPPAPGTHCIVIIPYMDTWTIYDFAAAVARVAHIEPVSVFFHGNPRVDSALMTEFRHNCRSIFPSSRNSNLPPWHLPDPMIGLFVHEPSSSLPFHTCALSDKYPATRGSVTYLPRCEENEQLVLAWYLAMRAKANMAKQPFAVQVFVSNKTCRNKWTALANSKKQVIPSTKLLDGKGHMHVVKRVLGPSHTSSYPAISTSSEPACLYRGHASWVATQTYSQSHTDHAACCGHMGYPLPSFDIFHIGLHAHELKLAEALIPHECHIPLVRVGLLFIPTFYGITQDLLDFVFVAMARVLDYVVVYGPSREEFVAAL